MKAAQILTLVGLVFFLLLSPLSCWYASEVKSRARDAALDEFIAAARAPSLEGMERARQRGEAAAAKANKWNFAAGVLLVAALACAVAHVAIQNIRKEEAKE